MMDNGVRLLGATLIVANDGRTGLYDCSSTPGDEKPMNDPLTDALRSVRLTGGIFVAANFTAPWSVTSCASIENLRHFGVRTTSVIAYHYVVEGSLFLGFQGEGMIEVKAGEIVIFPRNDCHAMASKQGLRPVVADTLVRTAVDDGFVRIEHGGGGGVLGREPPRVPNTARNTESQKLIEIVPRGGSSAPFRRGPTRQRPP